MTVPSVRKLRFKLELSQQQLASLLGLSFVTINKWENGKTPTKLATVILSLLDGALEKEPPARVKSKLRSIEPTPINVVRALAAMERSR